MDEGYLSALLNVALRDQNVSLLIYLIHFYAPKASLEFVAKHCAEFSDNVLAGLNSYLTAYDQVALFRTVCTK